jgi:YD repeat-containing protein
MTVAAYDASGSALTITDPLEHVKQQTFDARHRLSTSTNANAGVVPVQFRQAVFPAWRSPRHTASCEPTPRKR